MPRIDQTYSKSEMKAKLRKFSNDRIYMAKIKDTRSVLRAGDIKVWIYNSGIDEKDSSKWITASYCSPFYGTTPFLENSGVSYDNNPTSFGFWFPMPCVDNDVFIFFPNIDGENMRAYWFGCPMDGFKNSMLPGIPGQYFSESMIPTTELNTKNVEENYSGRDKSLGIRESGRPQYEPLVKSLENQGLSKDKLRGPSTSGSKREAPSMSYGILTPMGHSFIMDDGWSENDNRTNWTMIGNSESFDKNGKSIFKSNEDRHNSGFRLRTRNGTQLLISDSGNIYMINRDGSAWAEISDDGRLMGYAKNSVDIACDGDINMHAKGQIKMEAEKGFVFKTGDGISIESKDIDIDSSRIKTNSIITGQEINTTNGNIEKFQSMSIQAKGVFEGTLEGTSKFATHSGSTPISQPLPVVIKPEIPEIVIDKGIEEYPTHEPFKGLNHDKNDKFPKLDINLAEQSEEYKGSNIPQTVSNNLNEVCPIPPDTESDKNIPQMDLTEHFTLADLCYSDTAKRNGIKNVPDNDGIAKLQSLANNVLEKVYENYGQKVIVNSGYRGPKLNSLVGGASSSQHCKCEAADIEISGVDNYELACWIRDNLDYDQLILEFASGGGNNGWVHVSWKDSGRRKQCLTINKQGTRSGLIKT